MNKMYLNIIFFQTQGMEKDIGIDKLDDWSISSRV